MRVPGSGCVSARDLALAFDDTVASVVRELVFKDNFRSDGRGLRDIRPLVCQVTNKSSALFSGHQQI